MGNYRYCKKHNIKMPMSYRMAKYYLNLGYKIIMIHTGSFNSRFVLLEHGKKDLFGILIPLRITHIRHFLKTDQNFCLCSIPHHIEHL